MQKNAFSPELHKNSGGDLWVFANGCSMCREKKRRKALDNFISYTYNNNRKGAAGRRLPPYVFKEVTALLVGGGYFFLQAAITRPTTPMITSVYWNSSLYVTMWAAPLSEDQEARSCPLSRGPAAYRYGSAERAFFPVVSITQDLAQYKPNQSK